MGEVGGETELRKKGPLRRGKRSVQVVLVEFSSNSSNSF